VLTAVLVLVWILLAAAATIAYAMWWWTPPVTQGDAVSIERYLIDELQHAFDNRRVASAALILLRGGQVHREHAVGIASQRTGAPATTHRTRFIVASVSKAVTAWGVMRLVERGQLPLDGPVLPHLRRWQFPADAPYRDRVTSRHLLSHTAGLDDGLGYGGFAPDQPVQSIEESLAGPSDSTVGTVRGITVSREPGTAMAYSGGGYAVLQLLIEEVAGKPFADYMEDEILRPLGMSSASFDSGAGVADGLITADGVNAGLDPQPPRRYAAVAAVGLQATARDLAQFAKALVGPNPVLTPAIVEQMLTAQPGTGGSWGLGHTIFVDDRGTRVVGHDGGTPPSWGASVRVNLASGAGIVLVASGGGTLVTRLADVWTYAETGIVTQAARRQALIDGVRPAGVLLALGSLAIVVFRRRAPSSRGSSATPQFPVP
jgi:CubicO group peptidase (beta-lactamase class C family)